MFYFLRKVPCARRALSDVVFSPYFSVGFTFFGSAYLPVDSSPLPSTLTP